MLIFQKYEDEAAKITKQRRANYEKLTPQAQNALKIQTQERLSRSDKFSYHKKIKEVDQNCFLTNFFKF
jgi:hypothetical protein